MRPETKYKGSIKLAAIADALGWMTEFEKSKDAVYRKFGTDCISTFYDWEKSVGGRFHGYIDRMKAGAYSDDTQLLLAVARSIASDGIVDQQYFAKVELPEWLLYSRGAGRTIKNAARKIMRKSAKWNRNFFTFKVGVDSIDYRESGANGAAMRVLPIALANFGEIEKIKEEIFGNSIVTHGHPRAILGAMLYGYSINTILGFRPENFNYTSFLTELGKDMKDKYSVEFLSLPKFSSWVAEWDKGKSKPFQVLFDEIIDETQESLRQVYRLLDSRSSDSDALTKLGCFDKATKGSGTATVIAGIYFACKYAGDPLNGIEQAVNSLGTDTDSIAAFTGGLLGALHGQSIIPPKWMKVQDIEYLDEISIRMLEVSEGRAESKDNDKRTICAPVSEIVDYGIEVDQSVFLSTLGRGVVTSVDKQKAVTKGKYNLIVDVDFEVGQSCRFAKLLDFGDEEGEYSSGKRLDMESSLADEVNLATVSKFDPDTEVRIQKFLDGLGESDKMEFLEIIKRITNGYSH